MEAEVIRNHEAGNHGFAEAPARFDQAFVDSGHRMLGEHDSRYRRVEKGLDDDADAGTSEQPDFLPIGDGRVRIRRPPDFADGARNVGRRMDVQDRQVLAREARRRAVFVNGGRPHGKRWRQGGDAFRQSFNGVFVAGSDGLDHVAGERHAGRNREAVPCRLAKPHRLRPIERGLACLLEGDDLFQLRTVTSPASPSTRTRKPSAIRSVASRVPTTPGMPYSRETIAAWESRPPLSVTIPPRSGSRMLKASVVDSVTSTSPLAMRPKSEGLETRRAGPS